MAHADHGALVLTEHIEQDTAQARLASGRTQEAPSGLRIVVLTLALAAGVAAVWGGPPLGDHEAIVAQCARNMRVSGDWLVPELFDTPFIRKPPLAYWLVAGASYLFPNDPRTGLLIVPTNRLASRRAASDVSSGAVSSRSIASAAASSA